MSETRREKWNKPRDIILALGGSNERTLSFFREAWGENHGKREKFVVGTLIESAKELIFELRDGKPYFSAVGYYLDTETLRLSAALGFEILPPEEKEIKEHVIYTLALATAYDVPVYPNSAVEEPFLAQYYRDLHVEGFLAPDGTGKKVRLKLTRSPGRRITTYGHLDQIKATEFHSPAELLLIRDAVREELAKRDEAGRILQTLRLAVGDLRTLLQATKRNEHKLQRCLERHAILLGPDYQRIAPKHRLGKDFEMDYALIRTSGLVDLLEIESSTLRLFKKDGDPTAALVHAEQQVLDWLDWLERHHAYARETLPGVMQPTGFVVIGRSTDLTEQNRRKLMRRNVTFGGRMHVLTYDDLLQRAENLLRLLEGAPQVARDGARSG